MTSINTKVTIIESSSSSLNIAESNPIQLLDNDGIGKGLIVFIALSIGILAQGFINNMLDGERGLGAYLSDGSGYNKSKFKPRQRNYNYNQDSNNNNDDDGPLGGADPLPWLKLPKLNFVEVAGQEEEMSRMEMSVEQEEAIIQQLEQLSSQLKNEIAQGDQDKAKRTQMKLESMMKNYGFDYQVDEDNK